MLVIDRPAIVRINQGEIPDLVALVNIRNARHGELEERLGQRIDRAQTVRFLRPPGESSGKTYSAENLQICATNLSLIAVPFFVRLDPACIQFRLL